MTKPKAHKASKGANQITACAWHEPFVLYYDDLCDEVMDENESLLKFSIQMGFDELKKHRRQGNQEIEHLVGHNESFHLD